MLIWLWMSWYDLECAEDFECVGMTLNVLVWPWINWYDLECCCYDLECADMTLNVLIWPLMCWYDFECVENKLIKYINIDLTYAFSKEAFSLSSCLVRISFSPIANSNLSVASPNLTLVWACDIFSIWR